MSKLEDWSTTAASNDLTVPEGWPEGMSPGNVNNVGRQTMARLREWYQDAEWIALGHTVNSAAGGTIVFAGDVEDYYPVGRAMRADGVEGTVTAVSVSTNTTVDVSGITFAGAPVVLEVGVTTGSVRRLVNGTTKVELPTSNGPVNITATNVAVSGTMSVSSTLTATGGVTGNASTATKLVTPRAIALTGRVTGTANFDGSAGISIATTAGSGFPEARGIARIANTGAIIYSAGVVSSVSYDSSSKVYSISLTNPGADVAFVTPSAIFNGAIELAKVERNSALTFSVIFINASGTPVQPGNYFYFGAFS